MTVLCLALGVPTPNISLYISGVLIKTESTRHMVTAIQNVTTETTDVTCYAGILSFVVVAVIFIFDLFNAFKLLLLFIFKQKYEILK